MPIATPAAACQRRSKLSRSHASRSDSPSKAWSIITVAKMRAGTVGRPFGEFEVAVGEVVVGEHLMTVLGEQLVDRSVLQPITEHGDRIIEAALLVGRPKGHAQVFQARAQIASTDETAKSALT